MSEGDVIRSGSAGALLKAARERQGMHIAMLATAIKVSPRKLEALEADRYEELVDMTFTRALAQTVCRTLKIDPAPVLALLPITGPAADMATHLEQVGGGINAPFKDKPGRRDPGEWTLLNRPGFWATMFVLAAALALLLAPSDWLDWRRFQSAKPDGTVTATDAASAIVVVPAASEAAPEVVSPPLEEAASAAATLAPEASAPASAASVPAAAVTGALQLRSSAETWVQVQDASGAMLLSRNLAAGEAVGLDGSAPLRVTIGNASATQLSYRGKPVDLAASTRDNVARIELK